jgi:release factor glutamine methyltransferase
MQNTSVQTLIQLATERLHASSTAQLDAQLLMEFTLDCSKASLLAWPDRPLNYEQVELFEALLTRREQGEPIAYITGFKGFWTLDLKVTPDVLVPRPETELLVEWTLNNFGKQADFKVADLGTGSGAIAIAIATEKRNWQITATDQSIAALNIATQNAESYHTNNITFLQGDWCAALQEKDYDLIISNPPYIAPTDPHLLANELRHEPIAALAAEQHGFKELFLIAEQAKDFLKPNGTLMMEHGFEQGAQLRAKLKELGYQNIATEKDLNGLERTTHATKQI